MTVLTGEDMKKEKRKKIQAVYTVAVLAAVLGALSVLAWFHKPQEISVSERRRLAQFPALTAESVLDSSFMNGLERYSQDQFPFRESLRRLKSGILFGVYRQKDIHGIYVADGYAASIESEINESSVKHALAAFETVYDLYLKDKDLSIYAAIVPDKGYYLAQANGYPCMDYEEFFSRFEEGMPYAEFIDLTDTLTIDSYYRTDSHWRQECLIPTADALKNAMAADGTDTLKETAIVDKDEIIEIKQASDSFYGVYYGQAALPMKPDSIFYVDSPTLSQTSVYNFETDRTGGVYDWEKLEGNDPYDFFLSGAAPLLAIDNPNAEEEKNLIVFRDSYGSSLIPLLVDSYKRIIVIDIRYIAPQYVGQLIDFDSLKGADVLFLYGTVLLNNSSTLKK